MALIDDFTTLKTSRDVSVLAISVINEMQVLKQEIEGLLTRWNELVAQTDFTSVPASIKTEAGAVKTKLQNLINNFNTTHIDFFNLNVF